MLDAWRNPFARERGSAMALDEDYRREVLEERRLEEEPARKAEAEMTVDELATVRAEAFELARADDLATYGRVDCPECGAVAGRPCIASRFAHYARAVAFVRRG